MQHDFYITVQIPILADLRALYSQSPRSSRVTPSRQVSFREILCVLLYHFFRFFDLIVVHIGVCVCGHPH